MKTITSNPVEIVGGGVTITKPNVELRIQRTRIVDQPREYRLRRRLSKQGLALHRGRCIFSTPTDPNPGYLITDPSTYGLVAGAGYEMSLDDVEEFINGP